MNIVRTSENTVLILFEQVIDAEHFSVINSIVHKIKKEMAENIVDIIPSYASIHITFNLLAISGIEFTQKLSKLLPNPNREKGDVNDHANGDLQNAAVIEIPVYYGSEVALDLPYIAKKAQLAESDVVDIHTSKIYDVYAIGFAPGFAYLGNVDVRIATARKPTPRQKVTRGSVGIADQQTAIYPSESPGGWQIIGRTPIQLIDYNSSSLTRFSTGDKVKFTAMSQSDYLQMGGEW
jgi:KipI family sensor histidine kinase inhibitor